MRGAISGLALVLGAIGIGCAGSSNPATSSQTPATQAPRTATAGAAATHGDEALLQADAQRAWCGYLDSLYQRALSGEGLKSGRWAKYEQCLRVKSTASPKMLKQTADCAIRALEKFNGDPFSDAYANEVGRCGTQVIDGLRMSSVDLQPYVASICARAAACGEAVGLDQCRWSLESQLGEHLSRAMGAINTQGRTEFKACIKHVSCQELSSQVAGCLEPIMDRLLWVPS